MTTFLIRIALFSLGVAVASCGSDDASVAQAKPSAARSASETSKSMELLPVVSLVLAPGMPRVASSAEMAEWRGKQAGSFGARRPRGCCSTSPPPIWSDPRP